MPQSLLRICVGPDDSHQNFQIHELFVRRQTLQLVQQGPTSSGCTSRRSKTGTTAKADWDSASSGKWNCSILSSGSFTALDTQSSIQAARESLGLRLSHCAASCFWLCRGRNLRCRCLDQLVEGSVIRLGCSLEVRRHQRVRISKSRSSQKR